MHIATMQWGSGIPRSTYIRILLFAHLAVTMATVLAERQSTPNVFSLNKYSIHRLLSAVGILLWPYFVKMDLRFWDSGLCGHNCVSVIHANWLSERIGL